MFKIQHFELPADDVKRAQKFYEDIFGWKITPVEVGDMTYYMLHTAKTDDKGMIEEQNAINGGMFKKTNNDDRLIIYATVDSIEDTIAKAEANGGRSLMTKTAVGDMGYMSKIKDTEGNVIGIWEEMMK